MVKVDGVRSESVFNEKRCLPRTGHHGWNRLELKTLFKRKHFSSPLSRISHCAVWEFQGHGHPGCVHVLAQQLPHRSAGGTGRGASTRRAFAFSEVEVAVSSHGNISYEERWGLSQLWALLCVSLMLVMLSSNTRVVFVCSVLRNVRDSFPSTRSVLGTVRQWGGEDESSLNPECSLPAAPLSSPW